MSKASLEKIKEYRTQRYGVVIDVFIKSNGTRSKRAVNQKFVRVLWDGLKTPSDHAQMRLVHEHELPELMNSYRELIGG